MPFDITKAERVRDFIESLVFGSNEWTGQKFKLLEWQWEKVIKPLYGTVDENGFRKYRFCFLEIPKKNGKTELAAALALYHLTADREKSPNVYSAASDISQAALVYRPAAYMAQNSPIFNSKPGYSLDVRKSRKRISYARNNGFYQVLSAEVETKHGLSPSAIFFDELHAQPHDRLWKVLTAGTHYARAHQLVFVMTTAGIWDINSVWWKQRTKAIQIKQGAVKQNNFLPVLYIADPERDDPEDRELWKKLNPSLGTIFTMSKIEEDYEIAKQDPTDLQDFLRFRLNIPIKSFTHWMPMAAWDECNKGQIDMEALKGKDCYGGLDASTKIDLTCFILIFPPQQGIEFYTVIPYFYVPEDTIMERSRSDKVHYDIWAEQGYITATPGDAIDQAYLYNDIVRASKDYNLIEVGYDTCEARTIAIKLFNEEGIMMVEVRQGSLSMTEPAKDILVKTMQKSISHAGHPVLRWCADNLVMKIGPNEDVRPMKDKAVDRIDGIVAMIDGWKRMIAGDGPSVYEERGVEVIE